MKVVNRGGSGCLSNQCAVRGNEWWPRNCTCYITRHSDMQL